MDYKSSSIKTDGLLITKEKMPIESVLDRLKKPISPKPLPVKDESETAMKEVAVGSESAESKANAKMDPPIKTEQKSVTGIQRETDSKENNLLKVVLIKIKKFLKKFGKVN